MQRDIQSQKNRIYTAIEDTKSSLKKQICERDVVIERLKNALNAFQKKDSKGTKERHWVIESNLRDIISGKNQLTHLLHRSK
jgi:septal ring factor EnvC (AmiA/AmiB activator)